MPTQSITGDAVWQGEVVVDRIVVVRAGASLTVRPGTRVRFQRIDWDGDGIGDAELTVEGNLRAVGTPGEPILFASAEPTPQPGDWKYLMVNFAERAELAYASVRHAYSGIQVHYSTAQVNHCEFRDNVDGVRFSTARLHLSGSWLHHNTNGIRFEERGHPALIEGNEISDNDVGVFAVTECRGGSRFQGNNIRRNQYSIKMGWEQPHDLTFPDNFWGVQTVAELLPTLYDGRTDPALGTVTVAPLRTDPAPVAVPPFPRPDHPAWRNP
jgi:hypothetical protein